MDIKHAIQLRNFTKLVAVIALACLLSAVNIQIAHASLKIPHYDIALGQEIGYTIVPSDEVRSYHPYTLIDYTKINDNVYEITVEAPFPYEIKNLRVAWILPPNVSVSTEEKYFTVINALSADGYSFLTEDINYNGLLEHADKSLSFLSDAGESALYNIVPSAIVCTIACLWPPLVIPCSYMVEYHSEMAKILSGALESYYELQTDGKVAQYLSGNDYHMSEIKTVEYTSKPVIKHVLRVSLPSNVSSVNLMIDADLSLNQAYVARNQGSTAIYYSSGNSFDILNLSRTFAVTPSSGPNGSISPSSSTTVSPGDSVTFTASPNTGYIVDRWYKNGVEIPGSEEDLSLPLSDIQEDTFVLVRFKQETSSKIWVGGSTSPDVFEMSIVAGRNKTVNIPVRNRGNITVTVNGSISGNAANWANIVGSDSFTLEPDEIHTSQVYIGVPDNASSGTYSVNAIYNGIIQAISVTVVVPGQDMTMVLDPGSTWIDGSHSVGTYTFDKPYYDYFDISEANNGSYRASTYCTTLSDDVAAGAYNVAVGITAENIAASSYDECLLVFLNGHFIGYQDASYHAISFSLINIDPSYLNVNQNSNGANVLSFAVGRVSNGNPIYGSSDSTVRWRVQDGCSLYVGQTESAWWKDNIDIDSITWNDIDDGYADHIRIYADVDTVATEGKVYLYNSEGDKLDTVNIDNNDDDVFWDISRSKLDEDNNVFIIKGDPSDEPRVKLSNIRFVVMFDNQLPNLEITKTLSSNKVLVDENVTVTVAVENVAEGSNTGNDTDLGDFLPVGLTLVSGYLNDDLGSIDYEEVKTNTYTIVASQAGRYTLPSAKVEYETINGDDLVDESTPIELIVTAGQLLVDAQITPPVVGPGKVNFTATVTDPVTNQPIQDVSVQGVLQRKNGSNWETIQTSPLGWSEASSAFVGVSPEITTAGDYRAYVISQKDLYDEGQSASASFTIVVPELSVTPVSQTVNDSAGTTTFTVNNTGSGTMSWTASVISGGSWLSIASGSSGTNSGTITAAFLANTSGSSRTGTIRVTASGSGGSPKDVTVIQSNQDNKFARGWRYTRADVAGSSYYPWGSTELTDNILQEKFSINNAYGSVLTGDVTGDGHLELIYVSGDQLKIYDGTGNLLHSVTLGSSNCSVSMLEDINGDGVLDIGIGTGGTSDLKTYFYDGEGNLLKSLSKSAGSDCSMRPAGLLGNGDFVVSLNAGFSHSDQYRGFAVYDKNTGSEKWCYKVGPAFGITSIADFDGDGKLEFTNYAATVYNGCNADGYNHNGTMTTDGDIWLIVVDEQGNEKFSRKYTSPSDGTAKHYFADLNHDGVMEIVGFEGHDSYYQGTSEIHLFDQNGEITHTFAGSENAGWSFTVADIDGDGKDEVIASNYPSGQTLYVLDHNLVMQNSAEIGGRVQLSCDLNGNGNIEIVLLDDDGNLKVVDKNLQVLNTINVGSHGTVIAGDMNHDGIVELICMTIDHGIHVFGTKPAPCLPPGTPSNPNPSDGTTGVPINTDLDWSNCSNTDSYDVYFGTSSSPPYYGNTSSSNYSLPTLSYSTHYYWKIVAKNGCGNSIPGPVWDFTTEPCYTLSISVSPSGGGSVSKSPNKSCYYNENVTLTAHPSSGYKFVHWGGALSGSTNPATIYINGNKSVTAYFTNPTNPTNPTISGYVKTSGGSGIGGVTLSFSIGGGSTTTNSSGYYSKQVSYGWSGAVTPSKSGYTFSPSSRSYSNVKSNQTNQNYTGYFNRNRPHKPMPWLDLLLGE